MNNIKARKISGLFHIFTSHLKTTSMDKIWFFYFWRTSKQWRAFSISLLLLFFVLDLGIQIYDGVFPTIPLYFLGTVVFYFCVAVPLAWLFRNNP